MLTRLQMMPLQNWEKAWSTPRTTRAQTLGGLTQKNSKQVDVGVLYGVHLKLETQIITRTNLIFQQLREAANAN